MSLLLKNPHSILAVLETRPRDLDELRISPSPAGEIWERIRSLSQYHRVKIVDPARLKPQRDRRPSPDKKEQGGRTGAPAALIKEQGGISLESLFSDIEPGTRGLYLALDTVQDPQNLGAIFRTAAFFGVRGIVLTRDRSAPLSAVAYDVASGGLEHVPFSLQTNLSRALDAAKAAGLWVLGTSEHAETSVHNIQPDRPWLLVLGNEEKGLRRLTLDKCDTACRIPSAGPIASLNVSAAAAILIHHLTT